MTNKNKSRFSIFNEFSQNKSMLKRFISGYLISNNDIEDITQETFLRAFKAEQEKKIDFPKAFLFRIAKNIILSEFARKGTKITDYIEDYENSETLLEGEKLEDKVIAQQRLGIYCEAIASLPAQCRRVVVLKKVYGMQNKEIARRLEISVSTVEKHLSIGIRKCSSVVSIRYDEDCKNTRTSGVHPSATILNRKEGSNG